LLTRRKFFSRFLIGASAVATIGSADALFVEPKNLVSEHVDIRLTRLPKEFHGFRIAQISDVHFGPYMGKTGLERALQLARSFRPDLLVRTGDFVSHPFGESNGARGAHCAEPCADVLAAVRGIPVLAVLGNHDHWNKRLSRARSRTVGSRYCATAQFPWNADPAGSGSPASMMRSSERRIWARRCTMFHLQSPPCCLRTSRTLQIKPRIFRSTCNSPVIPMAVRLPGIGALILPALARKYPVGLNQVGSLQVYTNRGLGVINPPVRF
jgi:uncharacterized protein